MPARNKSTLQYNVNAVKEVFEQVEYSLTGNGKMHEWI